MAVFYDREAGAGAARRDAYVGRGVRAAAPRRGRPAGVAGRKPRRGGGCTASVALRGRLSAQYALTAAGPAYRHGGRGRGGPQSVPAPDVTVFRPGVEVDLDRSQFPAADVLRVVEIVSPNSRDRDRVDKPVTYARAGIAEYWIVEQAADSFEGVVHQYALTPTAAGDACTLVRTVTLSTLETDASPDPSGERRRQQLGSPPGGRVIVVGTDDGHRR